MQQHCAALCLIFVQQCIAVRSRLLGTPITMGILAVTRAAERVTGVTTRAMRVAAAGSVSVDPLSFRAPGRNADPTPTMDRPLSKPRNAMSLGSPTTCIAPYARVSTSADSSASLICQHFAVTTRASGHYWDTDAFWC